MSDFLKYLSKKKWEDKAISKEIKKEESVVCSITGRPSDFKMGYYKFSN